MQNSKTTTPPFRHSVIFSVLLAFLFIGCSTENTKKEDPDSAMFSKYDLVKQLNISDLTKNTDFENPFNRPVPTSATAQSPLRNKEDLVNLLIKVSGVENVVRAPSFGIIEKSEFDVRLKDNIIEGTFYWEDFDIETEESIDWVSGTINCVVLENNNMARLTGYVTDSSNSDLIGTYAVWRAIGEDDFTTLIFTGFGEDVATYHCETGIPLTEFFIAETEYISGEVKVKSNFKLASEDLKVDAKDVVIDFIDQTFMEHNNYTAKLINDVLKGTFYWEGFDKETGESIEWASGEVICMTLGDDGITARLGGVVTDSSNPDFIGQFAVWIAVDEDTGDFSTDIRTGFDIFTVEYHCTEGFTIENFEYEVGELETLQGKIKIY